MRPLKRDETPRSEGPADFGGGRQHAVDATRAAAYARMEMLPDFPAFKDELGVVLDRFLRRQVAHHMGFLGTFGRQRAFEGSEMSIHRATGDSESNAYEEFSVSKTLPYASVPSMTLDDVLRELDAVAKELAAKQAAFAVKRMDETLDAAGQTLSLRGAKMSGEALLQMLERIELSFDEAGRMHVTLMTHPNNAAAGEAAVRSLADDPDTRARYEALIERKRESWRAREASRRLVG